MTPLHLNTKFATLDPGAWIQDRASSIHGPGSKVQDLVSKILDPELLNPDQEDWLDAISMQMKRTESTSGVQMEN